MKRTDLPSFVLTAVKAMPRFGRQTAPRDELVTAPTRKASAPATHVYFALIADPGDLHAGANAPDAAWFPIAADGVRAKLAIDHKESLVAAVTRLRSKVENTSLPVYLLPREFTLTELQKAFETVLGREVEKSAFRTGSLPRNSSNAYLECVRARTARPSSIG